MKIKIIGNGAFGRFLNQLLQSTSLFQLDYNAHTIILAVPLSAYPEVGAQYKNNHLINVCSVQEPSTNALVKAGVKEITSIHPLFGPRTPPDKRNSISTWYCNTENEQEFLGRWSAYSRVIFSDGRGTPYTPASHDKLMAKTHLAAVKCLDLVKPIVDEAADIPDYLIPNSFRLLRQFAETMEDMPAGTIESIRGNPYG